MHTAIHGVGKIKMNTKQNLHIHTNYTDGKDAPEEIVMMAMERGFASIGFSEHTYLKYSSYPRQLNFAKMEQYKQEIKDLKVKYQNEIDIYCGLEYDFYSDVDTSGLDYVIGAVHYLDCERGILTFDRGLSETLDYVKENFGGSGLSFAKKYFETVARLPEKGRIDIIGHFDLLAKNNEQGRFIDTSAKEYLDLGMQAIHDLKGKIDLFEINTGAISRGYTAVPYPQMEFLKEFRRLGYGVVVTSDCHDKNHIDCFYDEAEQLLLAAGFTSKFILTANGFQEVSL